MVGHAGVFHRTDAGCAPGGQGLDSVRLPYPRSSPLPAPLRRVCIGPTSPTDWLIGMDGLFHWEGGRSQLASAGHTAYLLDDESRDGDKR